MPVLIAVVVLEAEDARRIPIPAVIKDWTASVADTAVIVLAKGPNPDLKNVTIVGPLDRRAAYHRARWSAASASDFQAARREESAVAMNRPLRTS